MDKIIIYHYPRCSKSRQAVAWFKEKGYDVHIVDYSKVSISKSVLVDVLGKLDIKPLQLIRTKEVLFKTHYQNKIYTDGQWMEVLVENPKLIQRPIIVYKNKAIIGLTVEDIDCFICI